MTKSSILIDLDDARSEAIAEVLSNKTSKKILSVLAGGEKSASDVAAKLDLPLNTASYNLKKLVEAGLVERSKGFFWSRKGKKMELYKVANKKIVIMPKRMVKGIVPVLVFAGLAALGVRWWTQSRISAEDVVENFAKNDGLLRATGGVGEAAMGVADLCNNTTVLFIAQSAWLWFLVGALSALLVYLIWNWKKK